MANEIDIKLLDRRTAARYIARGQLSEKDWEKHLKSLPDVGANAEPIGVEQPGAPEAPEEDETETE